MINFVRYLIVLGLLVSSILINQTQATPDVLRRAFECSFELISYSSSTGSATIELTFEQFHDIENVTDCDKLQVSVIPIDGLEYYGTDYWEIELGIGKSFITQIDVKVPVNDTSGFLLDIKCDKIDRNISNYIIAINDTAVFSPSNPLYQLPLQQYGTPEEEALISLKLHEEAIQRYEKEQKKILAHQPKMTTKPIAPFTRADSLFYDSLTDNGKKTFAQMKYLELQGPSQEPYGESVLIDNYGFKRDSGQTYFYRVKSVTRDEIRADSHRRRDSLLAVNPPNVYDVIIDLRNQSDYLFVKDRVDIIEKTEREGFYRIECSKAVITEIEQRKIKYTRTHRPSWIKSDSAKVERRKQKDLPKKIGNKIESSSNMSSLFFEGFETNFPGSWRVGDDNALNGIDYWGGVIWLV